MNEKELAGVMFRESIYIRVTQKYRGLNKSKVLRYYQL
jgi:hypothetical protein